MNRSRNLIIVLIIIILILIVALVGAMVYIFMNENDNTGNKIVVNNANTNDVVNEDVDNNEVDTGDITDEVDRLAIETFNAIFESYEGTELSSAQIKALLSQIEINNTTDGNEHVVTLNEDGVTSIEQVEDTKKYNVELSHDDEGYINEIKITDSAEIPEDNEAENENTTGDMDKLIFNTTFTAYLGNITGEKLNSLLLTIQESNGKYPEHQITLSSNNLQNLNGIVATDIYTITLSYDDEGYVNNINIDKKV